MRCDEAAPVLPSLIDGVDAANYAVQQHVEQCLKCQAELARYRKLSRGLEMLRTRYVEPTPGLLGETLAAITDVAEKGAIRSMVTTRRVAMAGGGLAAAGLAAGTAALLIARSRRRAAVA